MLAIKEIVYGALTIIVIFIGIIFLGIYPSQAQSTFKSWIDGIPLFGGGNTDSYEDFNSYFNGFLNSYQTCRDSEKKECWCNKDELNLLGEHSLEISQKQNNANFELLNQNGVNPSSSDFFVQNINLCFISSRGKYSFNELKDSKITIENKKVNFHSIKNVEFKGDLDMSYLTYKDSNGDICFVDEVSSKKLKDKVEC